MPLPTISTPSFELTLPSSGKKIKYRPFLVKEEKVLILALETGDTADITRAIKDVLKACISTRGVKVDQLPTFDIEYLFLNVRARSVGETVRVLVNCPDDGGETQVPVEIDINDVQVVKNENHSIDIDIDGQYKLRMKYPSLYQFIENNFETSLTPEATVNKAFKVIAECMDTIFTAEDAWDAKDYSAKERLDFIEQLNSKQYKEVEKFFATMPKLTHSFEVENPNTKVKNTITLEGLADFFA